MTEETLEKLAQLLEQDQFELLIPEKMRTESGRISDKASASMDIPLVYLMNDAVESFLVFRNVRMTGEYHSDYQGELQASMTRQDGRFVLVIKQDDTVLTLFFEDLELEVHLYEYAYTGHFWVKDYEYLRQLEYRLAILRDKYDYLGEAYCTEEEIKLAALVEFPPLNYCCYPAVPEKYIVPRENPWIPSEKAIVYMKELAAVEKCPYSLDELNSMIRDVDERSEDIREAIEQYHHQLADEKEQQLSICRQEQEEEQHLYETLRLTGEFLQNAKEQFSARYLGPIENGFGKYYTLLTGDKEKDWMVDANIEVQMKEQGEMRETKWLSAGYQDLLGICMRLALVDAMYPKEKPFLVLDDPFVNLDEEKMAHGNELFGKISGEYQILYFTCHASRNIENTK